MFILIKRMMGFAVEISQSLSQPHNSSMGEDHPKKLIISSFFSLCCLADVSLSSTFRPAFRLSGSQPRRVKNECDDE
jgi:hypothetical protein